MYQLFNGYHLGTNRALFVVAPRPHTVSDTSHTEFNLIDGERKLEGIQDIFLVVHLPRSLDGFCIQAGLDTGHEAIVMVPYMLMMKPAGSNYPTDFDVPTFPPDTLAPPDPMRAIKQLVITRRIVQSCGTFDENGLFNLREVPEPPETVVVGELAFAAPSMSVSGSSSAGIDAKAARIHVANSLNLLQSRVNRLMLDNASSVRYTPRRFAETDVFKSLSAYSARTAEIPLTNLVSKGYLNAQTVKSLARKKITTVADLFNPELSAADAAEMHDVRAQVIDKVFARPRRRS